MIASCYITDVPRSEGKQTLSIRQKEDIAIDATYVESPIEKYIRQVQTVAQGNTASQMIATAIARTMNRIAIKPCCDSLRTSRIVGSLAGISSAYTGRKLKIFSDE